MNSTDISVYARRRATLASQLCPTGVAIIPTAPEQTRNRDSHFLYRHDSYFYYLTGFTEPNAYLVIDAQGGSTLFCQPKDLEREIWDGYRLGPTAAVESLGVDEAFSIDLIDQELPKLLENRASLWYPFSVHSGLGRRVENWLSRVQAKARAGIQAPTQLCDVCAILDEMRLIKDSVEIPIMRRAGQISASAHVRAMQFCSASLRAEQPICEYHLDAELLYEFRRHGSEFPAYSSIVASGANACVLHYRADKAPITDGQLVLIDAGCEYAGYAGDITRTFPASGVFTKAQRALYDVVLESQYAALSCTKSGALFTDPHQAALTVLAKGLLDLGILSQDQHGSAEDVLASKAYFPFYMHRTSHWLGMDVHDCGSYTEPSLHKPSDSVVAPQASQQSRILRPGMCLTIEPGLYIRPSANVPIEYHNLGIRIEDDALITETGHELLTRDVPVDALEIEKLMR
jgi:Xaa-Pro aminopeptidase